jgi:ABC-type spermidine/putrescine transport system permease subunit I
MLGTLIEEYFKRGNDFAIAATVTTISFVFIFIAIFCLKKIGVLIAGKSFKDEKTFF